MNIQQITYGSEATTANEVSTFYRTLPSVYASNYGRLRLMYQFLWHRVAIVPDSGNKYYQAVCTLTHIM